MDSPSLLATLSPKLALTHDRGFELACSRQQRYERDWHLHDCVMLLWPLDGGLVLDWAESGAPMQSRPIQRLSRATAVLLPAGAAHHSRATTSRQIHGELYLSADLIRRRARFGAVQLDDALRAMLGALAAPSLVAGSDAPLVEAIVRQLAAGRAPLLATGQALPALGGKRSTKHLPCRGGRSGVHCAGWKFQGISAS